MSLFGDVQKARNPREAILMLAAAIDQLEARLEDVASGGWDDWGPTNPAAEDGTDQNAQSPQPWATDEEHVTAYREWQRQVNSVPPERAIELLREDDGPVPLPEFAQAPEIKRVSEEKMERRRMFERQQLKIGAALGEEGAGVDWTDVYAKGGPVWLYTENRDLVMGYPTSTRQAMVADVEEDDPETAYVMALDMLKQPASAADLETGAGALAVSNLTSEKARGR